VKIVNFRKDASVATGVVTDSGVIDLENSAAELGLDLPQQYDDILRAGPDQIARMQRRLADVPPTAPYLLDESSLAVEPAVLAPQKIICVGLNYSDHVAETGLKTPVEPILFSKFANALAASGQNVSTRGFAKIDYEAELGLVIGKQARDVSPDEALDYVFGYTNANDFSERDLQFRSGQWLIGKTPDGFLPIGPYLVTADEIDDPQKLRIRGWMNGELRQDSNTCNMIFTVAEIVSYASRYMTLLPGDVIVTGTPPGVILGTEEKIWMQDGDCYEVEVEGLGRLSNSLVT
jgi:2-keto-4-pentenoate hydratase/2-oxohepta-3-ene-1,7-dioic acid hydratase in catechol pathway